MTDDPLDDLAAAVLAAARLRGWRIATAKSCTGGLIAGALTDIPGSSDVFERGYVTYSNAAKSADIGVPMDLIAAHGAVSSEVATAMAAGALARSGADLAAAVTGVAGPGGGSASKPVGLVHVAVAGRHGAVDHRECRFGDIGRREIRAATVFAALTMLKERLDRSEA